MGGAYNRIFFVGGEMGYKRGAYNRDFTVLIFRLLSCEGGVVGSKFSTCFWSECFVEPLNLQDLVPILTHKRGSSARFQVLRETSEI